MTVVRLFSTTSDGGRILQKSWEARAVQFSDHLVYISMPEGAHCRRIILRPSVTESIEIEE